MAPSPSVCIQPMFRPLRRIDGSLDGCGGLVSV
jgi:hypothetical protein